MRVSFFRTQLRTIDVSATVDLIHASRPVRDLRWYGNLFQFSICALNGRLLCSSELSYCQFLENELFFLQILIKYNWRQYCSRTDPCQRACKPFEVIWQPISMRALNGRFLSSSVLLCSQFLGNVEILSWNLKYSWCHSQVLIHNLFVLWFPKLFKSLVLPFLGKYQNCLFRS